MKIRKIFLIPPVVDVIKLIFGGNLEDLDFPMK